MGGGQPARTRQTVRNIGQKSFFRKKTLWRDSTVTTEQEKRAIRITQYSRQYFDLANTSGGTLAKYLVFNEPVLINLGNQTYLIEPPSRPQEMLSPVRTVAAIPGTKTSLRVRPTR